MNFILDILLFPMGVFIDAFLGVFYSVQSEKMRRRRRSALLSLAACAAAFALAFIHAAIAPKSPATAVIALVGFAFMLAFLVGGTACAREGRRG